MGGGAGARVKKKIELHFMSFSDASQERWRPIRARRKSRERNMRVRLRSKHPPPLWQEASVGHKTYLLQGG